MAGEVRDDQRRQAEGQFIDDEQVGGAHERAPDRHHLLLASGEGSSEVSAEFDQVGEELIDLRGVAVLRLPGAEAQVLVDGHVGEELASLGNLGHPAVDLDAAARDGQQPADRVHQCRLARAVGPDEGDHLAAFDGQADLVEGRRRTIADHDVGDPKHPLTPFPGRR